MIRALAGAILLLFATSGDTPRVHLINLRGGWTSQPTVSLTGTVNDRRVTAAHLLVNGQAQTVNVSAGRFLARVVARPGLNVVEARVQNAAGQGRDRISFFSSARPADLTIVLTWDTPGTDLDLHVTGPGGEECYYGSRKTAAGGALEVDDTDGWGPEIYRMAVAPLGEYRIAVAYYDAGRAAQTEARVEATVRGGTPFEMRYSFPVTLTHEDEILEVGTLFIDRAVE
jgi:uncharacterized protein YfaP (DUF2135 family)